MMVNGRGGPRDHAAAQVLFTEAAEKDHAGAQFALGALLGGGHEVPIDRAAAQGWFEKAAGKGHPYAMLMFGRYLVRNLAGTHDVPRGRAMLEAAHRAGVADAAQDIIAVDRALAAQTAPSGSPPAGQPALPLMEQAVSAL
jgi:TPR repeat protein